MPRFVQGGDRDQVTLLPECLDDYLGEDNPVRVVEPFVEELDLEALGFEGMTPAFTGRPSYHPAVLLKIYIYGYLNRIQSSRRLERECQRNVELMWLTGRLAPDFKTITDFRRHSGAGIRNVCRRFVVLCRDLKLFSQGDEYQCPAGQRAIYRFTREENGMQLRRYWSSACPQCQMKQRCTPSSFRRIARWEHEAVLEDVQRRLNRQLDAMTMRRRTIEHVFGTLKHWMGSTHFLTRRLDNVSTEMSLHVLAYNLKRMIAIIGMPRTMKGMEMAGR